MRPSMELNKGIVKKLKSLEAPRYNKARTIAVVKQVYIESTGTERTTLHAIDKAMSSFSDVDEKGNLLNVFKFSKEVRNGQGVFKGINVKRIR